VETPDMTKYTPKQVKVRAGTYETSFNIQVVDTDRVLQSVTASGPTNKTQALGLDFDRTGLVVTGQFSDGTTANLTSLVALTGYDKFKRGPQSVTVKVNGKTAPVEGIVTRIGSAAQAIINSPGRAGVTNPQANNYKHTWIKGEGMTPEKSNIQFIVSPGGGQPVYATDTITLSLGNGRLFPEDFTTLTGYNPGQTGKQTLSMTLDGRTFNVEIYVINAEPDVWFDYGYMRHTGDPTGHGPGAGAYYAQPGETLIIAPVRYMVGYNTDNSDTGATYTWTVSGGVPWTTSKGGELLHVTPAAAGTYTIGISVTGTNPVTGASVTKTASAELVCYEATLPAGTFVSPLKNFGAGQMSEGGTGYGWSLGSAGGYEVWTVDHQASYKIQGNPMEAWQEAGIVWMLEDRNGNGLPDETWHELRGGDDDNPVWKDRITRRYAITYFKGSEHSTVNEYGQLIREVYWADAKGRSGEIGGGFPSNWGVIGNWVTYTGTLLRDDGNIATGNYGLTNLPGYVDAATDTFPITAAMDLAGNPVTLSAVKFIKVQTAILCYGGLFGDVSTEIKYADFLGTQSLFPDPN
jgi:archaellum component FlaG (FlaF/FlaG flagellin family)